MDERGIARVFQSLLALAEENAEWIAGFHPGLKPEQVSQITKTLLPFCLSNEVTCLYELANGHARLDPVGGRWLSLWDACDHYALMEQVEPLWIPALFPLFNAAGGMLVVAMSRSRTDSSPVFLCDIEQKILTRLYDSVELMLSHLIGGVRAGVVPVTELGDAPSHPAELETIRLGLNPAAYRKHSDAYERRGSAYFDLRHSADWPLSWKESIGRDASDYTILGATHDISSLSRVPDETVRVEAEYKSRSESAGGTLWILGDRSTDTRIWLPCDSTWSRDVISGEVHEITLERMPSPFRDEKGNVEWRVAKTVYVRDGAERQKDELVQRIGFELEDAELNVIEQALGDANPERRAGAVLAAFLRFRYSKVSLSQWAAAETISDEWRTLHRLIVRARSDPSERVRRDAETYQEFMAPYFGRV